MKNLLTLFLLMFTFMGASAQDYLWPVQGKAAGTDIVCAPQGYIKDELNEFALFIGGNAGDTIVAPVDATIANISVIKMMSLIYHYSYGDNDKEGAPYAEMIRLVQAESREANPRAYSISITLEMPDGTMVYIGGIEGDFSFKTGQKVKRGEPIGVMGYSYNQIGQPNIRFSREKDRKVIDPMAPFSIKSTFIAPTEKKPVLRVSKAQAKEDFTIYFDALKELYPGLQSLIPEAEQAEYLNARLAEIDAEKTEDDSISIDRMLSLLYSKGEIHDSHYTVKRPAGLPKTQRPYLPQIALGFINDTLHCTNAPSDYQYLIGQQILACNGIDADSARTRMYLSLLPYDADVQSTKRFFAATINYGLLFSSGSSFDAELLLADSSTVFVKGVNMKENRPKYVKDIFPFSFQFVKEHRLSTQLLNDSTAYLKIGTFNLTQLEVDSLAQFIQSIDTVSNLIVDVRNNAGGDAKTIYRIYSYLAGSPMTLDSYQRVNAQGGFQSMKYSLRHLTSDSLFLAFQPIDGKSGYFYRDSLETNIKPDSVVNYPGRLYMLTNEFSSSAATVLPALMVRNHRGVTVGRETCSAYHRLNALKNTDIQLPNSKIVVLIPMIEICFDTQVNERVPYGRGLLPDYEVPISLPELWSECGDTILNRALELIANNEYINYENPFFETSLEDAKEIRLGDIAWYAGGGLLLLVVLASYAVNRKRKAKRRR